MPLQVGEEWIDDAFIKEEIDRVKQDYKNRQLPIPTEQELDRFVKESIARRILLRHEAEKRNIPCSEEEVDSALTKWGGVAEDVSKKSSELRKYLRSRIMVDKMLDEVGRDHHHIKEDHLNYFYQDNRDDYDQKIFYLVEEVAFFFKENLPREERISLQAMEKTAKGFRDDFISALKNLKAEEIDTPFKFSSKTAEVVQGRGNFSDVFVKHETLGWHDDVFFHFLNAADKNWESDSALEEKKCSVTPLLQFSKGFLFYVKAHATLGKNLDKEKMHLVLRRDLQTEVQKNNIDLFVKKLFKETKIIDHQEF